MMQARGRNDDGLSREPAGFLCSPTGNSDGDNHFLHFTGMLDAFPSHQPGHSYFKNNLISIYYFQQSTVCENNTFFKSQFLYIRIYTILAQSCPTLCSAMDCSPPGSSVHGNSPGKNTGVGCHALPQGTFPTQVSHIAGNIGCYTSNSHIQS